MALSELQPNTRKVPFLRMRTKIWRKNNETLLNRRNFATHRKSMSLRTTVTTDFGSEVEIMQFLRKYKENKPTRL